ncbi:hypothetical protein HanPI659440_Chr06g0236021 [Helianthus annuus]|nr:hypothetical protein HanPI659440_Chr06g0236021 [Helianthus annuus]
MIILHRYSFLDAMGLFGSNMPTCPADQHCSQWARTYMKYCLCTRRDWISLILGIVSVISWGVAEVPQIITNYKDKSSEGLAIGFLFTWILGDLMNVLGCLLEPATVRFFFFFFFFALIFTCSIESVVSLEEI